VKIGGGLKRIEWDVWDRRGADSNLETRMGWAVCSKSAFVSCRGDPTLPFSWPPAEEPDYPDEVEGPPEDVGLASASEPTSVFLQHDFFTDLVDEFVHSWFVGASVVFITNAKVGLEMRVVGTGETRLTPNHRLTLGPNLTSSPSRPLRPQGRQRQGSKEARSGEQGEEGQGRGAGSSERREPSGRPRVPPEV
jgi:hypothetical protein